MHIGASEVVERTGKIFTVAAVSAWATGVRTPTRYDHREALARDPGIPMPSWDEPVDSTAVDDSGATNEGEMKAPASFLVRVPRDTATRIEAASNGAPTSSTIAELIDRGLEVIEKTKEPHHAA